MITEAYSTLLDAYNMEDWGMTWEEFLDKAIEEFSTIKKGEANSP